MQSMLVYSISLHIYNLVLKKLFNVNIESLEQNRGGC